jgi:hypothetical protein
MNGKANHRCHCKSAPSVEKSDYLSEFNNTGVATKYRPILSHYFMKL